MASTELDRPKEDDQSAAEGQALGASAAPTVSTASKKGQSSLGEAFERLGVFGAVLAGLLGLIVAIFCFFVPGLHFILGPFGPFLGGLVGGHLTGGGLVRVAVVVAIVSAGMTGIAAAFTGIILGDESSSALAKAAPFIVFFYTAIFCGIGATIGGISARSSNASSRR